MAELWSQLWDGPQGGQEEGLSSGRTPIPSSVPERLVLT